MGLDDNPWLLRRAIEYLTGGLSGLRRAEDGRFEVTVVRPRRPGPVTDPGWDIGQIGGHDLAVLHAIARDDTGEPWKFDVGVADLEPTELRFPALDLRDPCDESPRGRAAGSRGVCLLLITRFTCEPHPAGSAGFAVSGRGEGS
jgi:hypothetical protein